MFKLLRSVVLLAFLVPGIAVSAHHVSNERPNAFTQVNLCNLNDDKSLADVEKFNKKFFDWTRRENIEPYSLILTPVANASEPTAPTYDFVEMLTGSYERMGNMWDKASGSEEGQRLLSGWAEIATCATRFTHLVHKYNDEKATTGTDNRVVEFNRCEVQPHAAGLIKAKHARMLASRSDRLTNMYWGILLPAAGGEFTEFRHMLSYPDMASYTAGLAGRVSAEGTAARLEYNRMYAQCDGPSVWSGRVQNRPAGNS